MRPVCHSPLHVFFQLIHRDSRADQEVYCEAAVHHRLGQDQGRVQISDSDKV